ncbi:MAG: inverse autotransporter beta domain-containing protein, partial [Planctomycetaceae bacterium]|nr:inverse autotransporter beta domain-containing protein [Planctomycetaceae bacterium]
MHWTRRVGLLCLGLLLLNLAENGLAQDEVIQTGSSGVVYLDDVSGSMSLSNDGGTYLLFHKVVGDGVGFDTGYSRIGLRAKIWEDYDRHVFGEIHTLITDSSRVGFNVGGGFRKEWHEGLWGIHGWYDNYESRSGFRYQQLSFGSEYLHPVFDLRTNVYYPIGEDDNFISIVDFGDTPRFLQRTIGTDGIGQFERAYKGIDVEGGTPFPYADWLRMYAGTYFLNAKGNDVWGVRGRAEARVSRDINVNFLVSDDDTWGTNVNLDLEVRFSGQTPTRFDCNYCNLARRYDQVRRNWSIQTHRDLDDIFIPLNNPRTGEEYDIVWVDNTAGAGGDGSFENPFDMLPGVADGSDLILVRRGIGDTTGRITLQPYQQILGEGKTHMIDTDRLGLITLPEPFRQTGPLPTLVGDGTLNPVITIANNSVVRGFNFDAANA